MSNSYIITDPSDSISCDGFIVVNSFSSFPIQSYAFSDTIGNIISNQNFALNLCNNVYIINVIDSAGCSLTDTIILGDILGCTDTLASNATIFMQLLMMVVAYTQVF